MEEGRALAAANRIEFFETSAKDGKGVADTFQRLVTITLAGAPKRTEVEQVNARGSFGLSAHGSDKQPPKASGFRCCRW